MHAIKQRERPADDDAIQLAYSSDSEARAPVSRCNAGSIICINSQRKWRSRPSGRAEDSHAANAKARAAQQVKAGNLTPAQEAKIDTKADQVLDKSAPIKHVGRGI